MLRWQAGRMCVRLRALPEAGFFRTRLSYHKSSCSKRAALLALDKEDIKNRKARKALAADGEPI
jgi:hypothetical protein